MQIVLTNHDNGEIMIYNLKEEEERKLRNDEGSIDFQKVIEFVTNGNFEGFYDNSSNIDINIYKDLYICEIKDAGDTRIKTIKSYILK